VLAQTYTHVLLDDREVDYETLLRSRSVSGSAGRERVVRTSVRTSTTRKS